MAMKQEQHTIKGMQRDLTVSKFSPEYAYENMNIRITAREHSTLLSVTNEKGTKEIPVPSLIQPNKIIVESTGLIIMQYPLASSIRGGILAETSDGVQYKYELVLEAGQSINTLYENTIPIAQSIKGFYFMEEVVYDDTYQYWSDIHPLGFISGNIKGVPLGSCTISKYIVLFTKDELEGIDYIYRLDSTDDFFSIEILYQGDLGFSTSYPIQTLGSYENDNIQKVYWVDGINQARVVNIINFNYKNAEQFNFLRQITHNEVIGISKSYGMGNFQSGVIQYALSYYVRNGQESAIIYSSPLYYATPEGRGGSPEETCSCAFTINIANADINFDGINIYSIHRTSLDATPSVKLVTQLPITAGLDILVGEDLGDGAGGIDLTYRSIDSIKVYEDNRLNNLSKYSFSIDADGNRVYTLSFKDLEGIINLDDIRDTNSILYTAKSLKMTLGETRGSIYPIDTDIVSIIKIVVSDTKIIKFVDTNTGSTVEPAELLYKGGEEITPYTIAQKDNTLFLGNLYIKRASIPQDIREEISSKANIYTSVRDSVIRVNDFTETYYPYKGYYYNNRSDSTTFKFGEEYRLGIIALHNTGKWSEVIPVGDSVMDLMTTISQRDEGYQFTNFNIALFASTISKLMSLGYIAVKPVIVYPELKERNIIAQGLLCPTVSENEEKISNSVHARSSWYPRYKILSNKSDGETFLFGKVPSSRMNDYLNNNSYVSNEIQTHCAFRVNENTFTFHSPDVEFDSGIRYNLNNCKMRLVGYAICTSNMSDYSITASDRYRTNITGSFQYKTIQYNYAQKYIPFAGFKGYPFKVPTAYSRLIAASVWQDGVFGTTERGNSEPDLTSAAAAVFPVFPWHRDTSLNNDTRGSSGSSVLEKKIFSTLTYTDTRYFKVGDVYEFKEDYDTLRTGIADLQVFDSNELTAVLLNAPDNSLETTQTVYYGNTDKAVSATSNYSLYYISSTFTSSPDYDWGNSTYYGAFTSMSKIPSREGRPFYKTETSDSTRIKYKSTPHIVGRFNNSLLHSQMCLPQVSVADRLVNNGPLSNIPFTVEEVNIESVSTTAPTSPEVGKYYMVGTSSYSNYYGDIIRYDGDNHYTVMSSNDSTELSLSMLTKYTIGGTGNYRLSKRKGNKNVTLINMSGNNRVMEYSKDDISNIIPQPIESLVGGVFLIADIYRDSNNSKFGGSSDSAYMNNIWIPAGKTVKLTKEYNQIRIQYTEGDTFYQRYDHLKTYPFDDSSKNNLVEIVSFMCETKINIDGRYDRNRGKQNNLSITPQNFNLLNPVYSQKDNFFPNIYLDISSTSESYFPNTITWTSEKINGAAVDNWTNISMASTLDLDGDKGSVTSLNTFNNEIYCFQEQGLSNIIFNPRVQIPTSDNIPIEISNSYKVQGKRYISNLIGCNNKWSICQTSAGIYFIDNLTNGLYTFDGQSISSLSDKLGFRQFMGASNSLDKWNPVDFKNFRTFYDKTNDDIYFINDKYCLAYSELIGQFTSFMSYEKTPVMFNYRDKFYAVNKNKVWEINGGDYNMFYGEFKPYYVTIVANQDEPVDKIFNTVEYRADVKRDGELMPNETFTQLDVWNEYQHGTLELVNRIGYPSPLKRKFRIWRANIPRDNGNRNRIRNTWAYVKLQMNKESTDSMELHDIGVSFFE